MQIWKEPPTFEQISLDVEPFELDQHKLYRVLVFDAH
jgi:hypothetical protein